MANRRFEMFEYRQVLVRLRQGDTDRDIARAGLMGRRKTAAVRKLAQARGWLDPPTGPCPTTRLRPVFAWRSSMALTVSGSGIDTGAYPEIAHKERYAACYISMYLSRDTIESLREIRGQ